MSIHIIDFLQFQSFCFINGKVNKHSAQCIQTAPDEKIFPPNLTVCEPVSIKYGVMYANTKFTNQLVAAVKATPFV